jgi:hypothetical protein
LISHFFHYLSYSYETREGIDGDTMPISLEKKFSLGKKEVSATNTSSSPSSTTAAEETYYTKRFKSNGGNEKSKDGNSYYSGHIRVIRPFVYVREHECREFARNIHLPVINENCPACFEAPKERRRIKKLLAQQESLFPATFKHLKRAMIPLMSSDGTKNLQEYANNRLQSGRVRWNKEDNDSNQKKKGK